MTKTKRGGARKGAGRKPVGTDPKQVSVLLTVEQRSLFADLGASKWLRAQLDKIMEEK
jgi:hypothetical protein